MINGFHTLFYSEDPEATRAFFRDVLEWPWLDAHDGWLLFKTPPSEIGVHETSTRPGDVWGQVPFQQASLMCDDIDATVADLEAKGVEIRDEVKDEGYGRTTSISVPGAGWLMLYEPRHPLAHELPPMSSSDRPGLPHDDDLSKGATAKDDTSKEPQ